MDFINGGLAAVCAGFFTNPLDVVKIRMQLQGELTEHGKHAVHYKNIFHAGYTIVNHDGILALQAGLVPALWFQLTFNGTRLGLYQMISDRGYTKTNEGNRIFYKTVLASGLTGMFGGVVASPFYLIKTHLQAQAATEIAYGHQHNHEGTWEAITKIYKEQGIKGLFRGCSAAAPRLFVGSMCQLTSFDYCKTWLNVYPFFDNSPLLKAVVASFFGTFSTSICVTPFDLVATRLYNQGVDASGKGILYNGYLDCVIKIWESEGFWGFYKGIGPSYMRMAPHTVLSLAFWDGLKNIHNKFSKV